MFTAKLPGYVKHVTQAAGAASAERKLWPGALGRCCGEFFSSGLGVVKMTQNVELF